MRTLLKLISFVGLGLTVVPSFLVFAGRIAWATHASAPFWMLGQGSHPATPPAP